MKLSERMTEWNSAVENADWLLDYSLDTASPEQLFRALQDVGRFGAARALRVAGTPLGYFSNTHFPVDKASSGMVKGQKTVRKQQRKAKK